MSWGAFFAAGGRSERRLILIYCTLPTARAAPACPTQFKHIDPRFQRLAIEREQRLRHLREQQQLLDDGIGLRRTRLTGRDPAGGAAADGNGPTYREGPYRRRAQPQWIL